MSDPARPLETRFFVPHLPADLVRIASPRDASLLSPSLDVSSSGSLHTIFSKLPMPPAPVLEHLKQELQEPGRLLRENQTVGFPTETVYGLGGSALSDDAIARIYAAKGRPSDNPLIVHISSAEQLEAIVCHVSPIAKRLIAAFWPGPLTLVLRSSSDPCGCPSSQTSAKTAVSSRVSAGLNTVAVRMPSHPVALALIDAAGVPVAAPSANTSGRPSPTQAAHVAADLSGRIAAIVDGRDVTTALSGARALECAYGVESTVVDISHLPHDQDVVLTAEGHPDTSGLPLAYVLRPGGVTLGMLQRVVGAAAMDPALLLDAESVEGHVDADPRMGVSAAAGGAVPKSPGMKYIHYAPRAPLHLVLSPETLVAHVLCALHDGERVGVLCSDELAETLVAAARQPAASPSSTSFPVFPSESAQDAVVAASACLSSPLQGLVLARCGAREDMLGVASVLYGALRDFDDAGVSVIFAETFSHDELGAAVMNRLLKAAGGKVIKN